MTSPLKVPTIQGDPVDKNRQNEKSEDFLKSFYKKRETEWKLRRN